jgi:Bacterial alpha-L-rhamnosidase 6 hairpin glycosidase domain
MQVDARAHPSTDSVVTHKLHVHALPFYTVPANALEVGASLGNSAIWINTKGTGAVERIFSVDVGQSLTGAISIRYAGAGHRPFEEPAGHSQGHEMSSHVSLRPAAPGTFEIHPAYQRHRFSIAGFVGVAETTFLPLVGDGDPPIVYQVVELRNDGALAQDLRIFGFARLRGTLAGDVQARYDPALRALVAHNASRPEAVRVFGVTETPTGYATSFDFGSVYDPLHVRPLPNSTAACGDILGCLQLDVHLEAGESRSVAFITAVSGQGEAAAVHAYSHAYDYEGALLGTLHHLDEVLACGHVLTPDPLINQGALWSKVNMLRVMARYPQGPAFTNEPGVSSNVVARDAAWFVYGNDHFRPAFSRALLDTFARLQYDSGKIPEYFSALDGHVEDYGLNINDDTPLFILAVNHHFRATGDVEWLRGIYPSVARAARYIIAQEDARGLVVCSAKDPRGNVWAIAGWRNIIPQYSINGAVTEINAECVAALRAAAHLTQNLGQRDEEAQEFFAAAGRLREAMDRHLLNPENGLYYLNIDADGNVHTDVTGDQIFPVMFRACKEDVGFRIISRLNSPDFRTAAGLRTASRDDPLYDPSAYVGLIGGVWPGLTWWYAFAAARYHPDSMVQALRSSFEHYAANPQTNNTVPGQFSEWFDGESLVNRGMRLSPWEPPRFLWAAVEGVCGLMLSPDLPGVNPLIPAGWKWVAVRRLPYHGREFTYFVGRHGERFHVYANADVQTTHHKEIYAEDVSTDVHAFCATAEVVALRRPGELMVLVGNVGTQTSIVPLDLHDVVDAHGSYDLRVYNSERRVWEPRRREPGTIVAALALGIEVNGFRAIELKQVTS